MFILLIQRIFMCFRAADVTHDFPDPIIKMERVHYSESPKVEHQIEHLTEIPCTS